MKFADFAARPCMWLSKDTSSFYLSTRVRFARNIKDFFFPNRASSAQQLKIRNLVFEKISCLKYWKTSEKILLEELDITDRRFLMERHLASYDLVFKDKISGLIVGEREMMSIMVNEEDHLRIQFFGRGSSLGDTLNLALAREREISRIFDMAKDPELGYLTACPTNVGTGLRISFLVHLPALSIGGYIGDVIESLSRIGIVVRGFYGEATKPYGDFFQVSNQVTLGVSEAEITEKLMAIFSQLEDASVKATDEILKKRKIEIYDSIYRSLGICERSRKISYEELMRCISYIRFGLMIGLALPVDGEKLNKMLVMSQPAHIEEREGRVMSPIERDRMRSEFVREILG
ncbi:MAG: hypothetical protein J7L54_05755 [Elusimicrobia bacterium]|nr:hypothetical protein [Elusimicrobiota bacterium]